MKKKRSAQFEFRLCSIFAYAVEILFGSETYILMTNDTQIQSQYLRYASAGKVEIKFYKKKYNNTMKI